MDSSTPPPSQLRSSSRQKIPTAALAVVGAVVGVGAAALYFAQPRSAEAPKAEPPKSAEVRARVEREDAPPAAPVPPPAAVRASLEGISAHPDYARWLGEPDVLSRAVAALLRVADGESPAALLSFLKPPAPFEVVERDGRRFIAPRSFARYDVIGAVARDVDPDTAAAAYRALKPALATLHAQMAPPGATIDATMRRALARCVDAKIPSGDVEVVPAEEGINYEYADAALESMSPTEKHLVRMGPKNASRVQEKCRALRDRLNLTAMR